ncbi:hypothetical protein [Novosphingobium sp. FSW06-99]|uniref:hypothetical protein n=1 Tax=Novosphingobium sp. FSW06-99 TaxID=1739113 RepID=UPI0012E338CE|nr:hypothetical protein [Novosphingobium sp. FSW06-99]
MAFKTLKTRHDAISLDALGKDIAARRAVAGTIDVPRNAGTRRTPAKRALLAQISKTGGSW